MNTSFSTNDYIGDLDPNNKLDDVSRIINFAVLDAEEITGPKELDAHIISLDAQDISVERFLDLFYHIDHNNLQVNKALANEDEISFKGQLINSKAFHLPETVLRLYGLDLGVELDCLDPCSSMDIRQQLFYYKSLSDMCSIQCALTFDQVVETIINRTEILVENDNWDKVFGKDGDPVSHQLIINARFTNANPAVRETIVKFRYNVEFSGEDHVMSIVNSHGYEVPASG